MGGLGFSDTAHFFLAGTPILLLTVQENSPLRAVGFSLIEMTVVMVVLGILAAVFIPRTNSDALSLSTQAEQFAGDIRYVQSLAMAQGQRYQISYTATTYSIYTVSSVAGGDTLVTHPSGQSSPITLAREITMSTNLPNKLLAFDGLGRPFSGIHPNYSMVGTAVFSLVGTTGAVRAVNIYPETGMVRLP